MCWWFLPEDVEDIHPKVLVCVIYFVTGTCVGLVVHIFVLARYSRGLDLKTRFYYLFPFDNLSMCSRAENTNAGREMITNAFQNKPLLPFALCAMTNNHYITHFLKYHDDPTNSLYFIIVNKTQ